MVYVVGWFVGAIYTLLLCKYVRLCERHLDNDTEYPEIEDLNLMDVVWWFCGMWVIMLIIATFMGTVYTLKIAHTFLTTTKLKRLEKWLNGR